MPYRTPEYHADGFERPRLTAATTIRVPGPLGHRPHPALVQAMDGFIARLEHLAAWNLDAPPPPRVQTATLDLLTAVVADAPDAVEDALLRGALVNVRLHPDTFGPSGRAFPVTLRTVLGVAWWRQTHNDEGYAITGASPGHGVVANLDVVAQLLDAGAAPQPDLIRRLRDDHWDVQGHPAMDAMLQATLDRIASPRTVPHRTVITPALRDRPVPPPSVVPETVDHGPYTWLNLAVLYGHLPAMQRWFERGGVVNTGRSDSVCAHLWDQRMNLTPGSRGPFTPDTWDTALALVHRHLTDEPEPAYRREVLGTVAQRAIVLNSLGTYPEVQASGVLCQAWLDGLMHARPLASFTLTNEEADGMIPTTLARVETLLRPYEGALLRKEVNASPLVAGRPMRQRGRL